jgi:MinD-like ATPase involved in chromosome partitioning or flagellar assembly
MSLIAVGSVSGAPGATTLALALALELSLRAAPGTPGPILVDADADGGDIAIRLGLDPVPGLGTLALAGRHGLDEETLQSHAQRARDLPGVAVVPGIAGPAQSPTLEWVAPPLAELAPRCRRPVVVDVGRFGAAAGSRALIQAADRLLVVCRPDTASIVHARSGMAALTARGLEPSAVLLAADNSRLDELSMALGRPVVAALAPERLSAATRRPAGRGDGRLDPLVAHVLHGAVADVSRVLPPERAPDEVVAAAMAIPSRGSDR